MRSSSLRPVAGLFAGLVLSALVAAPAVAQVPDPGTSSFALSPSACGAHYVFTPVMGTMIVSGTLRDVDGVAVGGHPLSVEIRVLSHTLAPCGFGSHSKSAVSHNDGSFSIVFDWRDMAGYGDFDVEVVINGIPYALFAGHRSTSPDLDASGQVGVIDVGILASGLPPVPGAPPAWYIDYNCDGRFDVLDFAIFAQGIGVIC